MVPVRLSSIGAIVPAVLATVAGYTAQAFGPEGCASGVPSVPDWEVRGTRIYGGWGCGGDRRTPVHAALPLFHMPCDAASQTGRWTWG